MALSSSSLQPVTQPSAPISSNHGGTASLLSMLLLTVYAAQKSNKSFRKLKRKYLFTALKLKLKSMFTFKKAMTDKQIIIYILIGVLALVLVFYYPLAALILALVALILLLTGTI